MCDSPVSRLHTVFISTHCLLVHHPTCWSQPRSCVFLVRVIFRFSCAELKGFTCFSNRSASNCHNCLINNSFSTHFMLTILIKKKSISCVCANPLPGYWYLPFSNYTAWGSSLPVALLVPHNHYGSIQFLKIPSPTNHLVTNYLSLSNSETIQKHVCSCTAGKMTFMLFWEAKTLL